MKPIPIIALTAHAGKGALERYLAAGRNDSIAEPMPTQERMSPIASDDPSSNPAATASPNIAPADLMIDQAAMLAAVEGDVALLRELAILFLRDYPHRMAELCQAIAQRNLTAVARAAHALSGAVGTLGAGDAHAAACALEQAGWSGDLAQIPHAYAALEHEMHRLIPVLTSLIQEATS